MPKLGKCRNTGMPSNSHGLVNSTLSRGTALASLERNEIRGLTNRITVAWNRRGWAESLRSGHDREGERHASENHALVHGAWANGSRCAKVIPLLVKRGHEVTAVQVPLTSLADDRAIQPELQRRMASRMGAKTVARAHAGPAQRHRRPAR
jgi:hypothetical protein